MRTNSAPIASLALLTAKPPEGGGRRGQSGEVARQYGAEPRAKDGDDEVAIGGFWNLRLEIVMRLVEFGLPPDSGEARNAVEFAVEPLHDAVEATALEAGIARRRHEDSNLPRPLDHASQPTDRIEMQGQDSASPHTWATGARAGA